MSRIAKTPVVVPKNVKIAFDKVKINVEGPKGKLSMTLPALVTLEHKGDELFVNRINDTKQARSNLCIQ